jgi:hypothetical protein
MNRTLAGIIAAALLSAATLPALAAADSAAAPKPEEAVIPFVNLKSSIRDWEADGRDGIWVQDVRRDWFYAKLLNPCFNLDFATRVAFVTPGGRLDRFSSVIVEDEPVPCVFMSLTKSEAPPPKKERDAARKAAAKAKKEAAAAKPAG